MCNTDQYIILQLLKTAPPKAATVESGWKVWMLNILIKLQRRLQVPFMTWGSLVTARPQKYPKGHGQNLAVLEDALPLPWRSSKGLSHCCLTDRVLQDLYLWGCLWLFPATSRQLCSK